MLQDISAAIPIGFLLSILIGPVFFILLETAALKGFRAALALDLGVIFADVCFILIAYFSTNQLLEKIKDDPALFILGGVLLATYGVISFIQERKNYNKQKLRDTSVEIINKSNYFMLFFKGFLLNFINIGVLGFWLSIIIIVGPQLDMNQNRIIYFFAIVLATYLFIDVLKILLAKRLKSKLTPKRTFEFKNVISLLMIVFGFFLIAKGILPDSIDSKLQDSIEKIKPSDI